MSKARSLADLISGGAVIEASEIADSTITGAKLASDISITTTGTISTPSITGLSSLTIENVNIDNNSITSIASNIEQVSYTSVTTNIFTNSQTFNTGDWQALNATVAVNNTTAPDGTTTANKITQNSGSTNVDLSNLRDVGLTSNSGTVYTISIHAKISANRNFLLINDHISSNSFKKTWFNLSNGTVGTNNSSHTATITDVGNGWYRCSITVTSTVTNTDSIIMFGPAETDGTHIITDNQGSLFLWGAQLEESATLTGYLTTTSASLSGLTGVTRGVSGTTAATASSGDTITIGSASTTLSVNITATQNYIPLSSLTGVAASGSAVIGNSNIDLNLSASGTGNVKLVNDEKLVFGDAGENISGDGTDLSINSSGILNINSSAATGPAVRLVTSAGGILLDSNSLIVLDADNADNGIQYKDGATEMLRIHNSSSDVILHTKVQDKDLIIKGNDGGSDVTALTFDMSSAGSALFNSTVSVGGLVVRGGHLTLPGQLAVTDVINANNGVALGANDEIQFGDAGETISGDGTDLTIASSNKIILNADGAGQVFFKDGGTNLAKLFVSSQVFFLETIISDGDFAIKGNDGGSSVTALTLDMSEAGAATFNDKVILGANKSIELGDPGETISGDGTNLTITSSQNLIIDAANELKLDSIAGINLFDNGSSYGLLSDATGDFVIKSQQSDKDIIIKGNDGGSTVNALTFDMSEAGNATFNGDVTVENYLRIDKSGSEVLNIRGETTYGTLSVGNRTLNLLGNVIKFEDDTFVEKMRMHTNGYIGIGTSSPTSTVDIRGANGAVQSRGLLYLSNNDTYGINKGSQISFGGTYDSTNDTFFAAVAGRKENGTSGNYEGYLQFSTRQTSGNNERMRITSGGCVGIGHTNPVRNLSVFKSDYPTIQLVNSTSSTGSTDGAIIQLHNTDMDLVIRNQENADIRFDTNGANERMKILSNGKVGIGVGNAQRTLHVKSSAEIVSGLFESAASTNLIRIVDSNTTSESQAAAIGSAGDNMTLTTNGSERMRIDSSGNVGIGTSSPVSKLTVAGQITATPGATSAPTYSFDNDTNTGISRPTTDAINFVTNGSENMRISSNGAVGINSTATTLPLGTARFVVQGGSSTEYVGIDQYGVITVEKAATGLQYAMEFRNPNGLVGRITTENSATSYNTSSDYRLKENVNYDFDATSRLKQLKPARFNFIADADKTVDGFLAHEVSSVVPEAISGEKDAVNEDGSIQPQGIDQSKLVPLLVKTIQELEARIQTLEGN